VEFNRWSSVEFRLTSGPLQAGPDDAALAHLTIGGRL
jgi:hypothetical protein